MQTIEQKAKKLTWIDLPVEMYPAPWKVVQYVMMRDRRPEWAVIDALGEHIRTFRNKKQAEGIVKEFNRKHSPLGDLAGLIEECMA